MVDTIERVLYPISLVSFICGFGILRYPYDHARFRLSIFYMLSVWSVYAYIFYFIMSSYLLKNKDAANNMIGFYMLLIDIFLATVSIIIVVRKHEKLFICIRKLGLVNDTLEKLGTPKEYPRMRKSIKRILVIWFIITCTTYSAGAVTCVTFYNDIRTIFIPMVMHYSFCVNTFMDLRLIFLLRYVGTRLDKINNHVEQLSETEEYGLRCTWRKSHVVTACYIRKKGNRRRILWIAMHLHSELCRVARNLNNLFGLQMTLQMMSYFVILIGICYINYHIILCLEHIYKNGIIKLKLLMSGEIWIALNIIKLILLNYICENVNTKAEKTKNVMHKLTNLVCFIEQREEILQFIMQISIHPLKFSGMGLFYFGYNFIRKFFAWILTIVIFVIQIDSSLISRLNDYDRKNTTYCN